MQIDSSYADVKHSVKDQTYMTVDSHTLKDADDVVVSILTEKLQRIKVKYKI